MSAYKPHQISASDELWKILEVKGLACLWGSPRSGKTRTAIRTADMSPIQSCLVLTKKNAIEGWHKELKATGPHSVKFTVTNYEQAHKLKPSDYQLVIGDESHLLNKVGKPTLRFQRVARLAWNKPVILLTGTPAVEKLAGLYYQLGVTRYSPFSKFGNFYGFFGVYGTPNKIYIRGNMVEQYDKVKPTLLQAVEPYVVRMTQEDAGITVKAVDKVHKVELSENTRGLIEEIMTDGVAVIAGKERLFDSDMAIRAAVHQIETGAVLLDENIVDLDNSEVVDYIARTFGNAPDIAVMAHYRSTREKLRRRLPRVTILSSDGHAEGVDLSGYRHFIIANSAYSGAKFIQRRERGVNINRTTASVVHHIITDCGVSQLVYDQVSQKRDFNLRMFRDERTKHTKKNLDLSAKKRMLGSKDNQQQQKRSAGPAGMYRRAVSSD